MLIHLVKATPFTPQELRELRQVLDEKTE